mmetsp:Transcript_112802/g.313579  ORF Transcript_112802/g.313579 Transcript_112802/m.313579 type:complete len:225 (+) Transcript_112802:48-722(+)
MEAVVQRSPSAPVLLRPLEPPCRSPFGLDWLDEDPPEFARQRYTEARRKATRLLNTAYRSALQQMGEGVAAPQPWPPRDPAPDPEELERRRRDPLAIYRMQPTPIPQVGASPQRSATATRRPADAALPALARSATSSQPLQAPLQHLEAKQRRKEAVSKLFDWGKYAHGGPFTFGQVFEEIDADVRHRPAKDTRTVPGKLGPVHLGCGATRAPRELPQLRRKLR